MSRDRQILACSGVLRPPADWPQDWNGSQVWQAIQLSGARAPKVCLIGTATGDASEWTEPMLAITSGYGAVATHLQLFTQPNVPDIRAHLLSQDVIFVSGGSVVNQLAVWRAHRVDEILLECWEAGVVLSGQSAGSLCWHLGGVTDSFGDSLDPVTNCLGFLPYSNGVHDDLDDQPRRERYRELIASGELPAGYATQDGVGLHYVGTQLHEALSVLPEALAWHIAADSSGGWTEMPIKPRQWNPPKRGAAL
jgi:peptidase E